MQAVAGGPRGREDGRDQDLRRLQPRLLPGASRQRPDAAQPRHQRDLHRHDRDLARPLGKRAWQARARGPETARPDLLSARRDTPIHERHAGTEEKVLDPDVRDRRQRAELGIHGQVDARDRGRGRDAPPGALGMEFGVFDHVDLGGSSIERFYRERLELVGAYERAGFHAYHVAEHHLTPLGMAPSPSVFLAAVAQRTTRLRFGPMVYVAPLYHPLRLLEEIGMLDQMSGGRLELAFRPGALRAEVRFFHVHPAQSGKAFQEIVGLVAEGLREGAGSLSEEGGK